MPKLEESLLSVCLEKMLLIDAEINIEVPKVKDNADVMSSFDGSKVNERRKTYHL